MGVSFCGTNGSNEVIRATVRISCLLMCARQTFFFYCADGNTSVIVLEEKREYDKTGFVEVT